MNGARLTVSEISVQYPGVLALDGVSLEFVAGEIHAIVGENGAGKSTLMKVLSGSIKPTRGVVQLDGVTRAFAKPSHALAAGIAMVHQELNLVATLSVAENVLLGRECTRWFGVAIDRAAQAARARELLSMLGADLDLDCAAGELTIAQAQFVEIAKCLASDARVLILDEPTAVLGEREAARLLARLRLLRDEGRTVIFISHHLDEVVAIADRVSVLRDGRLVHSFARAADGTLRSVDARVTRDTNSHDVASNAANNVANEAATEGTLASAMVGRTLGSIYPEKTACASDAAPVLELIKFGAVGRSRDISLTVRAGEIVGLAGLVGSGRTETAEAMLGLRKRAGELRLCGEARVFSNPRSAMQEGVAYVSEDRKGRGLHVTLSSIVNMTLPSLDAFTRWSGACLDRVHERAVTDGWINEFAIRCARPDLPISSLSGGNQQKFALARWMQTRPKVLIMDEPTRGVDVGAKGEIYRIIAQLARQGVACIIISSELPELIGVAHRVLVIHEGALEGEVSAAQLREAKCEERIVRLASGLSAQASDDSKEQDLKEYQA